MELGATQKGYSTPLDWARPHTTTVISLLRKEIKDTGNGCLAGPVTYAHLRSTMESFQHAPRSPGCEQGVGYNRALQGMK